MSLPTDAISNITDPNILSYLQQLGPRDAFLDHLEQYAAVRHFPLIGRQSGQTLSLLTRLSRAQRVFEFGSGWGYSALFFAQGGAEVFGAEKDQWELDSHEILFNNHPLKHRIHLHHGDAFEVFAQLPGTWDIILIDLHKVYYLQALQAALPRLNPGGIILADNVLWGGKVTQTALNDDTRILQAFNRHIFNDPTLNAQILPIGDGLAIIQKH